MTQTLERPSARHEQQETRQRPHRPGRPPTEPVRVRGRFASWLRLHLPSLAWLTPALAIAAVLQAVNLTGSPQRIDDEGTYTAQAWAIDNLGKLTHYTYWYDHPPLGWIQLAGYFKLTGALGRYDSAVMAGREAILVFTVIAAALVFVLARRIGLSRPAAAGATLLFAVSPLALQYHRQVYLDNIATMWLLAAFVFAMPRKHQLLGYVGAAAAFGVAVLSKETFLLALPFLVWAAWRSAHRDTRRYTLAVAATVLVLVGFSYVVLALIKGELLPGPHRVSLFGGITFQLGGRQASGSVFDPKSLVSATTSQWWQLDPVFMVLGSLAGVVGLAVRRLRPYAAFLVFSILFMLRPGGYVPVPYVIIMLPFAALLVAGVTDALVRRFLPGRALAKTGAIAWTAVVVVAAIVAAPLWGSQLRGFLNADEDAPYRQSVAWLAANVPHTSRLMVDDGMWVDLVERGFPRDDVVWYYKVDTDPQVEGLSPSGWRDYDYVITTNSMRTFTNPGADVSDAIRNSVVVASFGQGTQHVDIRRIDPQGLAAAKATAASNESVDAAAGADLARNPRLTVTSATDRDHLANGGVDARVSVALGQLASTGRVTVAGFPSVDGDTGIARQALITSIGGTSVTGSDSAASRVRTLLGTDGSFYTPSHVRATSRGVLVEYPLDPTMPVTR